MGTIVFLVGLVVFGVWAGFKIYHLIDEREGLKSSDVIEMVVAFIALIVISNLASALVVVPAGHRVVIFNKFTGVKPKALNEGLNIITPFIDQPIEFDVRVQKNDVKAEAASKDLQDVTTDVVLNFKPRPESVASIYQIYGMNYIDKVIAPAVQESVKAVVATYTAEETITKREEVKDKIQKALSVMIAAANIDLVQTYVTNFEFSAGFTTAIEAKQIAEQTALKAKRDLERIKIEAEQKIASARAEAESLQMQKQVITPELLKLRQIEMQTKAVEKWNGTLPNYMLSGTVPFLNLEKKD
jgi:regulator of protease activity HflC (stomatin/prohibitin superfamily)